jgi:regulator of nucleoside diphosphate kinase
MTLPAIHLPRADYAKLRLLAATAPGVPKLGEELDRAIVIEDQTVPPGLVMMDSHVEFEDLSTGEIDDYTLTYPDRANIEEKRLSVLAPIGTALIGFREGDIVSWATPGGVRRLRIRRVTQASHPAAKPEHPES